LLPKEKKLVEIVERNRQQGRKTLLFVEQTASRDIRKRLETVLEANVQGAKVSILSSSMAPARREMWLKNTAVDMDTLIVNPRLVETGLDLVMFSDIVFMELTYSLYTLWQSMRRCGGQGSPSR